MFRFRVKNAAKVWGDKGPDLLRKKENALDQLRGIVEPGTPDLATAAGDGARKPADSRLQVFDRFAHFCADPKDDELFKVFSKNELIAVSKVERIPVVDAGGAHAGSDLAWSLIKVQFGAKVTFAGGFVCKEQPNGPWSDHAWLDAIDATFGEALNDEGTDWVARMRQTGNMDFDFALGSRGGKVVQVYRDGDVQPSGASTSHLWHVHISVVDHDGARPPCA